ncbi:winged helix-turn-helix domain-containing protein [Haloarcula sediminis]|uniref:winged helix-turn-helix domain-containing protein n=1 Tax=Haloarcula sediminis TaxID=3111777 RepID=UPI002D798B21|nr:winged helix-turn-helix domain-containing protein [Haloarcula sp. CK38]
MSDNNHKVETTSTEETLQCIAGTECRIRILRSVSESTKDLRDLADDLSIPRTTVRHNIKQLVDGDLVTSTLANEYRTTVLGDAAITGINKFSEQLELAISLDPFLSCLSQEQHDIELDKLFGTEITSASRADPFAPANRLVTVGTVVSLDATATTALSR